ncbi:hypothetical protein THAOC_01450, partial [Thalassiosira oceanica]
MGSILPYRVPSARLCRLAECLISDEQGAEDIATLDSEILEWLHVNEGNVLPMHVKYIKKHLEKTRENPYGYACQLYKLLHKKTIDTRLVISDCGSLIHALGKWVNEMLHHAHAEDLLQEYPGVDKPSTQARPHSRQREYLQIQIWRRPCKTNHGHSNGNPRLYVAIHEEEEVLQYLACNWLLFLKRFIDDGIGIWLHHPDLAEDERRWKEFQSVIARGGLAWDFSKRSNQIDFMDFTISLVDN